MEAEQVVSKEKITDRTAEMKELAQALPEEQKALPMDAESISSEDP